MSTQRNTYPHIAACTCAGGCGLTRYRHVFPSGRQQSLSVLLMGFTKHWCDDDPKFMCPPCMTRVRNACDRCKDRHAVTPTYQQRMAARAVA